MLHLTRKQLAAHNGKNDDSILIAYKGEVYDVSRSNLFQFGLHYEHEAGEDLTAYLEDAPHGEEVLKRFRKVGIIVE